MIDGTHVESWDMEMGSVDEDYEDGRRCELVTVFTSTDTSTDVHPIRCTVLIFPPI